MILFRLRCANDHHFEGWFRDNAGFDAQAAAGEISCPECGDCKVEKAIMAPRLNRAHGSALDAPDIAKHMRQALGELRRKVEESCDYVGEKFPEEARRIHYGETDPRPIYGEATPEEARELTEEGVEVGMIPWVREN